MSEKIYGIDLGTTNSLIGLHSTGFLSGIVPSCANLETGEAGSRFYNDMSAKRSFKVDMSMGIEGITPRQASKCVIEELCRQVKDDKVENVVISVPAYFSDSQRSATITAATLAGLEVKGLVNEPTAAAMYIAQDKKGLFVVYDLGGGTFDVSIIDSRFGNYDVQATSGVVIGGDNFDEMLMRYFVKEGNIPIHKFPKARHVEIKHLASRIKVKLQKTRMPVKVDLTAWDGGVIELTPEVYCQIMRMTFADTINQTQLLINKYIPDSEVYDILLVGGSTHCPYLREWITEVTGKAPAPLTYDPDRVVALGAALYADILSRGVIDEQVSDVTRALSIGLYDGTVSNVIPANSKIPLTAEKIFSNPEQATSLILDLYQGESMFIKDNELIGQLVWDYDCIKGVQEGQVIVNISIDNSGVITFSAHELLKPPKSVVLKRNS